MGGFRILHPTLACQLTFVSAPNRASVRSVLIETYWLDEAAESEYASKREGRMYPWLMQVKRRRRRDHPRLAL